MSRYPTTWHLRDVYKSLTDEKPPRSWDYKRIAQELFRLHDQARMAAVYTDSHIGVRMV